MGLFSATEEDTTRLSFGANVCLFILKLIGGFFGQSRALLADALNSLLDIVANTVVWIGIRISKRPADASHPYGHGHADTIAALFVATLLVITGGYIGINAIHVIIDKDYSTPGILATIVAIITIVVKEILYHWTMRAGRRANSPAVIANAEDHRADVYASLGALVGIVVAQLGLPILDPIAGLWIGLLILKSAVGLMKNNLHFLMEGSADECIINKIAETAKGHGGVKHVRDIKVRTLGTAHIVDLIIMIDGDLSVREGHDVASSLKRTLLTEINSIQDTMIHVEPFEPDAGKDEK